MIDIEAAVFDELCSHILQRYPNMRVGNEIVMTPAELPCVCVEEISNSADQSTIDSGSNENYVNVDYEVRVYVNNIFGKRRKGREIMAHIDTWFQSRGFVRMSTSFIAFDDGTKYQTICRYTARTDGNTIYRR